MSSKPAEEGSSGIDLGPPLAWVLADLAASRATGVLRVMRPQGPAVVHFRAGRVTRIESDDAAPLLGSLVEKGDLLASQARAVMSEMEHLDVTLAQALERLGVMTRKRLDEIRTERTRTSLEGLVASGSRMKVFEMGVADSGPVVEVIAPVIQGLIRSGATALWLSEPNNASLALTRTEKYWKLRQHIAEVVDEAKLPAAGESVRDASGRSFDGDLEDVAALVISGLLEVAENKDETPAELEQRAAGLDATEEACRLLIRASELYEEQGDFPNARRAALSALRRKPTLTAPLNQVERICVNANEVATLGLVYELVNGAMPGPFGRRALLYRAGRLFEYELGDMERAREYFSRAVLQVPESGAALDALLRTSTELGDMRPVIDAYASIGLGSKRLEARETWLQQAAEVARAEGYPEIAQEILDQIEPGPPFDQEMSEHDRFDLSLVDRSDEVAAFDLGEGSSDAFASIADDGEALNEDARDLDVPGPPLENQEPMQAELDDSLDGGPPEQLDLPESSTALSLDAVIGPEEVSDGPSDDEPTDAMSDDDMAAEVSIALDALTRPSPAPGQPVQETRSPSSIPPTQPSEGVARRDRSSFPSHTPPPETIDMGPPVEVEHPSVVNEPPSDLPMTIYADPREEIRLRQLCTAFLEAPADIQRINVLREAVDSTGDELARAGVSSFLALFSRKRPSLPIGDSATLERFSNDHIRELAGLPRLPEFQALAKLWRAAPQLLTKELAELGVGRALPPVPGQVTPAHAAFSSAHRLIPSEASRLLHVPAGPAVSVVPTKPPSVLIGPAARQDSPELRFRVARAVAMGHPELLLPCLLGSDDLHVLLMALQAAFGESPPRGSLEFAAASLAQDLWSAIPRSAQKALRQLLGMRALPEVEEIRDRAMRSASLLALLVTGDAATALRVSVADDPFLAGTDPTTEEGFVRGIQKSPNMAALLRLALSPKYWELRLAV